ncbi:PREDICTED: uncharacterized protein LOC104815920 [Tarenaya hassleriana]|uniref:uncharacterized protein LOC104815920 n=1 Tax=Tarenaya hassleriana TaxID=28532 RepID=UPI00053C88AC|nr:PREDICTED: uncharacterized protein LOC104815920 [Tarenaya hassleriana]
MRKTDMEDGETQKDRNSCLFRTFQMISISFLSLLVPLSFLFLSHLSLFNYHLPALSTLIPTGFSHNLLSMNHPLHQINVGILYIIMSFITVATLIHSLCGKTVNSVLHSRLYIGWIVLFAVQSCIAIGIRGTVSVSLDGRSFLESQERWVWNWTRVMFFLGLHEVMLTWFRMVVKPVVDDTIFGGYTEERWSERAVVAATFGAMWWWKLRKEVEGLAAVAEIKRKLLIGLEVLDYVNWWMYYVCAVIGLVKVLRGILWGREMLVTKTTRKGCESIVDYGNVINV